jgi:hypothetical protein
LNYIKTKKVMKNLLKIFKRKPWYKRESKRAGKYFSKIYKLRIIRYILAAILVILIAPLLIFLYFKPNVPPKINYGTTFSWKYADELGLDWQDAYIKILDDLGVKNIRLIAYWNDTELRNDQYDFSKIKWQLDEAEKRDLDVILTLGRKVPRYPECFEPWWWLEIEDESVRDAELYDYIETTINELKGYESIKMWQVENEPFWPFGECEHDFEFNTLEKEIALVRKLDDRPVMTQDSGEGGFWYKSYVLGDYLGISMYRKIWYDFWGVFGGDFIYFKYPLAHWTYAVKAGVVQVPHQRIIVTELQAEPWGPGINSELSQYDKDQTMSKNDFYSTLSYAQKAGFSDLYLWGVEWWLWEKEEADNPFFWDTGKALFSQ